MVKKQIKRVLAVCLCFLVPILAATGQAEQVSAQADHPVETWVNAEYDGNYYLVAKIEIYPDGRELDYLRVSDTIPEWEGRPTDEEKWIDAEGNHWYKGRGFWHEYRTKQGEQELFFLSKVNPSGTVLESVVAQADYPEELSPVGGQYGIWYKQE